MTYRLIISSRNGKFPLKGLNELLNGRLYNFRTKKYHNSVKSENDKVCRLAIQKYMRGVKIDKPIRCTYMIYAGDKRHDRGNLACAVEKSFLDALQEMKVIKNDGFDDVLDSVFHTELCRDNPRVEVIIEEAILDEFEASNLERKIYDFFRNYGNKNISLEQLREISKIIWGENNGLE